jgi:hypothetical protein
MKRLAKKTTGLIKGAPSAVLISVLIHGGLLLLAGSFVVFTVIKKQDKKFVPPPKVERPKMDLKKPRVKMKDAAKPRAAQRITAKDMKGVQDVALPEISSIGGAGLGGDIGGFEMIPDASEMSLFGGTRSLSIGNDFEGTFYSFELDRRGQFKPTDPAAVNTIVKRFIDSGWNTRVFAPYYRSPQKLYTTQLMIPPVVSELGPEQFGVNLGEGVSPAFWMIHYKGKIARKEGGRFRLWGAGDNYLIVRVNKKIVLQTSFGKSRPERVTFGNQLADWAPTDEQTGEYRFGIGWITIGDWFELEPGVPVEMEVLFGDYQGGWFKAMVNVEEEGVDYDKNREGMPILPAFKTAEIPEPLKEQMKFLLIDGETDLESDLMFNIH